MASHCKYLKTRIKGDTRILICTLKYKEFDSEVVCRRCQGWELKTKKRWVHKKKKFKRKNEHEGRTCPICHDTLRRFAEVKKIDWKTNSGTIRRWAHVACVEGQENDRKEEQRIGDDPKDNSIASADIFAPESEAKVS